MSFGRGGVMGLSLAPAFDSAALGLAPTAYAAWYAAVKSRGGRVVTFPFHDDGSISREQNATDPRFQAAGIPVDRYGMAAAAYTAQQIYDLQFEIGFPDAWDRTGATGYYLAPAAVQSELADLPRSLWDTLLGVPPANVLTAPGAGEQATPDWYKKLKDLLGTAGLYLAVAGVGYYVLTNTRSSRR